MKPSRLLQAIALALVSATVVLAGVFGPGPNSTTISSTGQQLSIRITAPSDNSLVPIPPGTVQVQGNCAIGTVAGQTINVLYVVDVSGSTDLDFMLQNGEPRVDANGNGTAGDAGDDFNADGERGDVLDGEVAGVLALHASIGNPSNVNVGVVAFATDASAADVDPATPNTIPITQFFTTPPQADRNGTGGPDISEVLRSLDSDFTNPSGGQIKKFTAVSRSILGSGTRFPQALAAANAALTHFPAGSNIIFFLSDGESNAGSRCFQGACTSQLSTAATAHTRINTIGVGADADPVDLQYIANQTGGTYTQVTNPSQLATILPFITPAGLHHATVNGTTVALDSLGNFTTSLACTDLNPFTVTARCFASDPASTNVAADVTLRCFLLCGNGTVDAGAGEECDPPNTATCDATCQRVPLCGDGFLDGAEQCDPPNGTTCDTDCTLFVCGNGDVEPGEECDPPNTPTCDATCQRRPICGDGFLDGGEQCDPPNGTTCDTDCTRIVCGNGDVEPGEECEPPGTATCTATCQRVPLCGDGHVDAPESCEPPNTANCDGSCRLIACGNGIIQPGEECEPPSTATCDATCQRVPVCGDGHVDAPESCEPPGTGTCDASCRAIVCGNGIVQPGEQCEPPSTATCDAACHRVPQCGDGFLDGGEQCDPPNGTTCDVACRTITCGNGVVQPGEECEPPSTATCDATCQRVPHCGDGFPDGGELCDPPNGTTCAADCTPIVCGDAVVEAPEECEPPNTVVCDATCRRIPHCGDGFVDGPEQCDPPNGTTCAADCSAIVCGDGMVEGPEQCDPPNGTTCDLTCHKIPCSDTDHDGVCDVDDNCVNDPNPDQHDADGDGIGDACDPCTDTDGDGFGDPGYPANTCPLDNCAEEPNPDQSDLDHDGIGDLCDDEEAVLNLWFTSVKASSQARANGRTIMKGDFVTVAPLDVFDASDGIEVHLHDSLFLHNAVTWSAAECFTARDPQGAIKKIKCESPDHRYKAQFKYFKLNPGAIRFIIKLLKLEPDFPFLEPITLRLKHNGFIDRVGSISDCTKTNAGIKCRER